MEGSGRIDLRGNVLRGVNVLIVEDDFIVAFDMQTLLEEQGATIVGPATDLEQALSLASGDAHVQLAVLDVNLNGRYVFPVAQRLLSAGIPFVFATAYADNEQLFPEELRAAPRLPKPVMPNVLLAQLKRLLE